jgi:hypothetical protein
MGEKEKITEAEHLLVEISLNAKDGILNALKNISPALKHSKTITTENVHGIKDLSFSQTYITDTKGNTTLVKGYDYTCDLDDDYELKISCKLALTSVLNSKVPLKLTMPVMITHKREKWSIGYELCLTLNPLEFFKNGLYIVLSVPFFGAQIVIKYNIITKNVTILFRLPLKDGNDEDKKGAAKARCDLICLNILFCKNNISTVIYEYCTIKHFAANNQHIYNKLWGCPDLMSAKKPKF